MEIRKAGSMENNRIAVPDKDLTAGIICAAIAVHKAIGSSFRNNPGLSFFDFRKSLISSL